MLGALILWSACLAAAAAGLLPRARWPGVLLLAGAGVCAALAVAEGSPARSLDIVLEHPAFVGNQVEPKAFLIETTEAPGYAWGLASALFCLVLGLAALAQLPARTPQLWPFVLAWGGIALALALEKLAAPAAVVAFRLHGACWLATIVAAVTLARTRPRLIVYAAVLLLLTTLIWLPAAVFGTLATRAHWGTSLDVHSIEFCAHRLARTPLTLEPGSTQQLWYLVWAPLLMVFPLVTWISAGGVGFLLLMAQREGGGGTRMAARGASS